MITDYRDLLCLVSNLLTWKLVYGKLLPRGSVYVQYEDYHIELMVLVLVVHPVKGYSPCECLNVFRHRE